MKMKTVVLSIFIFFTLLMLAITFFDIDFQWRIRFVHDVFSLGKIPKTDLYTYTMHSFPFVDHSFVTSVIFALIYNVIGYGGTGILVASIATIAIVDICGKKRWLIPLVAAAYFTSFAVRDHVFSFLFLAILLKNSDFLFHGNIKKKILLPAFMLLWANFHGGFLIGLIYIWGYTSLEIVFSKKSTTIQRLYSILIAEVATLATLITPYGIGTWMEVVRTIFSKTLRLYVSEWRPVQGLPSFAILLLTSFFILSLAQKRKIQWKDLFAILLFFQAIMVNRFIPLFALAVVVPITDGYDLFVQKADQKINRKRLQKALTMLMIISVFLCTVEFVFSLRTRPDLTYFYPVGATEYLSQNRPKGRVFSLPHWNSYIMWKIPTEKVFLDTRMFVWNQKNKPGELNSASDTFIEIANGRENYELVFDTYCVDTVVWGNRAIDGTWFDYSASEPFINELISDRWSVIYENKNAVIYNRDLPETCKDFNKYQ